MQGIMFVPRTAPTAVAKTNVSSGSPFMSSIRHQLESKSLVKAAQHFLCAAVQQSAVKFDIQQDCTLLCQSGQRFKVGQVVQLEHGAAASDDSNDIDAAGLVNEHLFYKISSFEKGVNPASCFCTLDLLPEEIGRLKVPLGGPGDLLLRSARAYPNRSLKKGQPSALVWDECEEGDIRVRSLKPDNLHSHCTSTSCISCLLLCRDAVPALICCRLCCKCCLMDCGRMGK